MARRDYVDQPGHHDVSDAFGPFSHARRFFDRPPQLLLDRSFAGEIVQKVEKGDEEKIVKIGILSRKTELYSTGRLLEAAKARGHEVQVIDHLLCYMNIMSHHPAIHYKGVRLEGFDAVIPRIGASTTFYGTQSSAS